MHSVAVILSEAKNLHIAWREILRFAQNDSNATDDWLQEPCISKNLRDNRLCLNLNQHVGIDEAFDLDHAGGGANFSEELAVRFADLLPVSFNVEDVDARAHHVFEAGPGSLQRGLDVFEGLEGLRVGVADADDLAAGVGGGSA